MLKITEQLSAFINMGGGVTIQRQQPHDEPQILRASGTAEALLLYAILEELRRISASTENRTGEGVEPAGD